MTTTQQRVHRLLWRWVAPLAGIAALCLAGFFYFHTPRARTHSLTMTAGNPAGTRHDIAEVLRREVAPRGVDLRLRSSVGSEEALDWVNARQVDCALVQGGLSVGDRPNVRLVAMLHIEPLHLLVKKELFEAVSQRLTALEGKTVDTGVEGSGTHTLSVAVLQFAGLSPRQEGRTGGYIPMPMRQEQIQADASALPDAVFVVSSLPSRTAKFLVSRHGYRLVPLPFGEAFALESVNAPERERRDQAGKSVDKGRTYSTQIPAFTYGVEPPMPAQPLPTLGTRLLLVAHKDVDSEAVRQLIETLFNTEFAKVAHPPLDPKMMELPPELPWHDGAESYRRHNQPLVSGDVLGLGQKIAAILAATLSGLVVLWQWFLRRQRSAHAIEFRQLLSRAVKLDEEAMRLEENDQADLKTLLALRGQLAQVRGEALDRFTEGDLDDHELMASVLAHVNTSRDYLTRLIAKHHTDSSGAATKGEPRPS
jgi:TRAP-type uncharacterized transport system substrate-binding protein